MAIAIPVIAAELSLAFAFFVGTLGFPVIDEVNLGVECVLEGDMLPGTKRRKTSMNGCNIFIGQQDGVRNSL